MNEIDANEAKLIIKISQMVQNQSSESSKIIQK